MSQEPVLVNVTYRGMSLLSDAQLESSGFLHTNSPMPVGSTLVLALAGGQPTEAVVEAVVEARKAARGAPTAGDPGMTMALDPASWEQLGSPEAAPSGPEEDQGGEVLITAEEGEDGIPEDVRQMMDSSELEPVGEDAPPEEEPQPEPKPEPDAKKKRGKRKKKRKS